ncbi:MAG TPA: TIGR04283 family arsenosugar biosynthesis glycosyltransferase [Burkholderiaceae bacterium]|nr:TIGR04283 family arsenosugar biosynthesis glycosyltransferase [Burkholderiaceae bacterium]
MRLAIIVPVLDEAAQIESCLAALAELRQRGARVIVVDGGSRDGTVRLAAPLCDRVIEAPRGRALQMNAGARSEGASGADVLLFLHADVRLPPEADRLIFRALARRRACWGRFDVRLQGRSFGLRLVAALMNLRSRATGICTGDQAIFVEQGVFVALEGFAPIALMEDVEFCRRARRLSAPVALRPPAIVSARRWDQAGVARTVLQMWWLRLAYFMGADPQQLAQRYRNAR